MAGTLTISTLSDGTNSTSSTNCIKGSAKAWVQYDTSTGVISGSFNVSSITLGSTGVTTVNFTTAMPNTNYAFNLSSTGDGQVAVIYLNGTKSSTMTTTTLRISTAYWTGTSFLASNVSALSVSIFSL
jgi:hypothetical protein